MANAKRYLEVPFAEKDEAKALGARWDPARKKWYIPAGVAIAPFAPWIPTDGAGAAAAAKAPPISAPSPSARCPSSADIVTIAHTAPADSGFEPYCGEAPPWD